MLRRPPRSTRTDTLFPYTTLFRSGQGIGMTPELNNGACIAPKFVLTDPQLLTRRHRRGGDIVIIEGYPSPELRGLREQFRAGAAIAMPCAIGGEVHFVEHACHADPTPPDRRAFPRPSSKIGS